MEAEDRERLITCEVELRALKEDFREMMDAIAAQNTKLDALTNKLNVGRGVWLTIVAIGGLAIGASTFMSNLVTAAKNMLH